MKKWAAEEGEKEGRKRITGAGTGQASGGAVAGSSRRKRRRIADAPAASVTASEAEGGEAREILEIEDEEDESGPTWASRPAKAASTRPPRVVGINGRRV